MRIKDKTFNHLEFEEAIAITDSGEEYLTQFGKMVSVDSVSGLGTVSLIRNETLDRVELSFDPDDQTHEYEVQVLQHAIVSQTGEGTPELDYGSARFVSLNGTYTGTLSDVKRSFGLFNGGRPIFVRSFNATEETIVDVDNNKIIIPDHFYVTGEKLTYDPAGVGNTAAIGIVTTTIAGVFTDIMPLEVFAVKLTIAPSELLLLQQMLWQHLQQF